MSTETNSDVVRGSGTSFLPWGWLLLGGVVSVAIGFFVLILPGTSIAVAGILFAIFLLASGVLSIIGAVVRTNWGVLARVLTAIVGILSIGLGILCLRSEIQSLLLLATWIGLGWVFAGIARLVAAVESGRGGRGWLVLGGVFLVIAGIIVLVAPFGSLVTLTLVTGWLLVIGGVVEIVESIVIRRH